MLSGRIEDEPRLHTLASVDVVCRYSWPTLPVVVGREVSDFVAFAPSLVPTAGATGDLRLLCLQCARSLSNGETIDEGHLASGFNAIADAAAARGDTGQVRRMMELFPEIVLTGAVLVAAGHGHLSVLQMLQESRDRVCWPDEALHTAVFNGHLFAAQLISVWLATLRPDPVLICVAATQGDNAMVKWLWPFMVGDGDEATQYEAVKAASCSLARWMTETASFEVPVGINVAAARGDLDFLMWAQTKTVRASTRAMDGAAAHGHMSVVKWLHVNRPEGCTTDAIDHAAKNGHIEIVKWLANNRDEGCTSRAPFFAAVNGDLAMLEYLVDQHLPLVPPQVFDHACQNGHLHVVKWLMRHRHGKPSHMAMDWAVEHGHMDVVLFLHHFRREGCSSRAMDAAATNGDVPMLKWLRENRSEGCSAGAMVGAAACGHVSVLEWLHVHQQAPCTPPVIDAAAQGGFLECLRWLHDNTNVIGTTDAVDGAMAAGNVEVVQWFYENRTERGTTRGMESAIVQGHFEVMEYARAHKVAECSITAFRRAGEAGKLYEAGWVRRHYPHMCVHANMDSVRWQFGWTTSILKHAALH